MADEQQSFPIVEQPMDADQWQSVTLGIGDGILDEGGFPYRLKNLSNSTGTGVLQAAKRQGNKTYSAAILNGFYHRLEDDLELEFPPVTSATTYYVVLEYDPLRTDMPVEAKVVTELDDSQGKNYLTLYEVRREPDQLLTDATVRMVRPRVAPVQVYTREADMPPAHKTLWGTLAIVHNGRNSDNSAIFMSMNQDPSGEDADDEWFWKKLYDPADGRFIWSTRSDTGTYRSPAHGFTRAIGRRGKTRRFRGRVELVSGNPFRASNTDGYQIWSGSLADGDAPAETQRFIVACGGSSAQHAAVEISRAGAVSAQVGRDTYWISLDGIEWEAK